MKSVNLSNKFIVSIFNSVGCCIIISKNKYFLPDCKYTKQSSSHLEFMAVVIQNDLIHAIPAIDSP